MKRPAQIASGLLSLCSAQGVLVLGLALFLNVFGMQENIEVGLALIAAGLLLAMWWVIDGLVPEAGKSFTRALKLVAIAVFFICGTMVAYSMITGRYDFYGLS